MGGSIVSGWSNVRLAEIVTKCEDRDDGSKVDEIHEWFRYAESSPPEGVPELQGAVLEDLLDKGGEGQGDSAEVVRRITYADGHSELLRMTGYYASYYGFEWDWDDIHLCEAKEITVTIYDKA
jgi:hypothetical protein